MTQISTEQDQPAAGATSPSAPRWKEADRLAALERYAVLDTPREAEFDDVARLAADVFEAPIAVVNLIADGRQWFKAEIGIGADELPLDVSICAHAILQRGIFVVPDTARDSRFDCNPLVTGAPGLRFYAGALLETPEGLPLGTVCVLDTEPRPEGITARQRLTLDVLARQVMAQLELRRALAERDSRADRLETEIARGAAAEDALGETAERYRLAARATNDAVWDWHFATNSVLWNAALQTAYGHALDKVEPTGDWWIAHIHPADRARVDASIHAAIDGTADAWTDEYRFLRADGSYAEVFDRGHILRDADGTATRMIGAMLDLTERRRTEAALRESEERLRLAVDNAEVGFWDVDVLHDRLIWPPRTKAMFGISPHVPVTLQDFYDGLHPDDRDATSAVFAAAADPAQRALYDVEYRTVGKEDGVVRWVAAKGRGVFDEAGRCLRVVGTAIDITSRKRIEADLRASEARLRALNTDLEHQVVARASERANLWQVSPDLLSVVDASSGRFDRVSPAWTTALGWTADEMDGEPFQKFVHPDDVDASAVAFEQLRAGNPVLRFENRYRTRSGAWRWLSWVTVPEGGRLYSTTRDVTDEKARAAALAVATAERDRMWQTSPDLLAVLGVDGVLRRVNPAWRAILGYDEEEILGLRVDRLIHPDDVALTIQVMRGPSAGPLNTVENRYRHRDGGYRWISWITPPPQDGLIYATGRHVTAEKQRQAELEAAQDALRQAQKMEAVGQLTGGIAHDFNNLLTVVTGNIDMGLRALDVAGGGDPRVRRSLDNAQKGAQRAAALTHRLLAFSRRQPLAPKPTDVDRLVTGMSDLLARSLGETVSLEAVTSPGLWRVEVDPNQLEAALLNLAVNARDAMPRGGTLTIETANARLDESYTAAHAEVAPGQYVVIAVTDTGEGMKRDMLEKVFEPFFTTKEVGKGTGLGLSMVYGFTKQSGGHVKIYSEEERGTTVKLYLPRLLTEAEADDGAQIVPGLEMSQHAETILVVEDDDDVRAYTVECLRELGYRVLEAHDGPSALRLLERQERGVDLLFTDVVMPGMSGSELADTARAHQPDLRVLYTSGYTRNAIVHGGRLDAGVEMIVKPFTFDALARKVRDSLDCGRTRHILVVEHDATVRAMAVEALGQAGYIAEEAANAGEALGKVRAAQGRYDVVVLDAGLPDRPGEALASELRALHADLPILIAGAEHGSGPAARFAADRCVDVLAKPFTAARLADAVRQLGQRCARSARPCETPA